MRSMSRMPSRALPHELWRQVISNTLSTERRTYLSVSKLFHELSLPFVFSHITVRLGKWRSKVDPSEDWADEEKAEAKNATRRGRELLEYIIKSPEFAKVITKVSVRAYIPTEDTLPEEVIYTLAEALGILHLRGFAWYGCGPEPQNEVLYALAKNSSRSLLELVLPPEIPDLCEALPLIDCLKSLSFVSRYYSGDVSDIYPGTPRFDRMALTANVNQKSLRRLCILGEVFAACNTWSFSSLIDLALLSPIDSVGLHSVFEDLIQLQSLTICLDHFVDGETIADVFEEHSDALSHLKHFKLLAMGLDPEDINAVAAFLRLKASLERLDFVSQSRAGPELKNEPLLAVLNDLPHLTVFGCDVRTRRLTADHLARLSACIPQQVTGLVLNVAVEFEWATTEEDWAQFFEARRACRYLHIIPDCKHMELDLQTIAAQHPPKALELLGFNKTLRWVSRGGDGAPDGSEVWSPLRVYFRTVEDFGGHEEWEWLSRHHGQDAPLPIQPYSGFGADE